MSGKTNDRADALMGVGGEDATAVGGRRWSDSADIKPSDSANAKTALTESPSPEIDNHPAMSSALSRMLALLDETNDSLLEREQMFRYLAETVPNPICVQHEQKILYANAAFAELLGIPQKQLVQRELADFVHADDHSTLSKTLSGKEHTNKNDRRSSSSRRYIVRLLKHTGRYIPHSGSARVVTYRGVSTVISCYTDLSVHHLLKHRINREKSIARNVLNSLQVGVIVTDRQGFTTECNEQAAEILGRKREDVIGMHASLIMLLVNEDDHTPVSDPVSQVLQTQQSLVHIGETLIQSSNLNTFVPVRISVSALFGEKRTLLGTAVTLQDALHGQTVSEKLTYEATHDPLTGLINRREFEVRLGQAMSEAVTGDKEHVLCYLDLNNFKPINDTSGHRAGDDVLKQVSEKLNFVVRDTDSVGRLGGDEFGILLYACPLSKAREIVQDLCETVSHHVFRWHEERFSLGVACGMVVIKQDVGSIPEVLNAADTACYIAKQLGGSRYHVFTQEDARVARDQGSVVWQHRVQDALDNNRFELHIQKITSLKSLSETALMYMRTPVMKSTSQLPAFEVTARMYDAEGTRYRPELFMPAARRYGLLSAIDRLVVNNTFKALSRGLIKLHETESCCINLSAETFLDADFLNSMVESFDEYGINPKNICFEVPEPDVIAHLDEAKRFIRVLNDLGCQFALDDFGRELQSFTYLKQLNIHFLKLDGFYVRTIVEDEVNRAMVAAMIKLAHSLGMKVIAEQVESQAVLDILGELGADYAQGFIIENTHTLPI